MISDLKMDKMKLLDPVFLSEKIGYIYYTNHDLIKPIDPSHTPRI